MGTSMNEEAPTSDVRTMDEVQCFTVTSRYNKDMSSKKTISSLYEDREPLSEFSEFEDMDTPRHGAMSMRTRRPRPPSLTSPPAQSNYSRLMDSDEERERRMIHNAPQRQRTKATRPNDDWRRDCRSRSRSTSRSNSRQRLRYEYPRTRAEDSAASSKSRVRHNMDFSEEDVMIVLAPGGRVIRKRVCARGRESRLTTTVDSGEGDRRRFSSGGRVRSARLCPCICHSYKEQGIRAKCTESVRQLLLRDWSREGRGWNSRSFESECEGPFSSDTDLELHIRCPPWVRPMRHCHAGSSGGREVRIDLQSATIQEQSRTKETSGFKCTCRKFKEEQSRLSSTRVPSSCIGSTRAPSSHLASSHSKSSEFTAFYRGQSRETTATSCRLQPTSSCSSHEPRSCKPKKTQICQSSTLPEVRSSPSRERYAKYQDTPREMPRGMIKQDMGNHWAKVDPYNVAPAMITPVRSKKSIVFERETITPNGSSSSKEETYVSAKDVSAHPPRYSRRNFPQRHNVGGSGGMSEVYQTSTTSEKVCPRGQILGCSNSRRLLQEEPTSNTPPNYTDSRRLLSDVLRPTTDTNDLTSTLPCGPYAYSNSGKPQHLIPPEPRKSVLGNLLRSPVKKIDSHDRVPPYSEVIGSRNIVSDLPTNDISIYQTIPKRQTNRYPPPNTAESRRLLEELLRPSDSSSPDPSFIKSLDTSSLEYNSPSQCSFPACTVEETSCMRSRNPMMFPCRKRDASPPTRSPAVCPGTLCAPPAARPLTPCSSVHTQKPCTPVASKSTCVSEVTTCVIPPDPSRTSILKTSKHSMAKASRASLAKMSCASVAPASCPSTNPLPCPSSAPQSSPSTGPLSCPSTVPPSCPSTAPPSCPSVAIGCGDATPVPSCTPSKTAVRDFFSPTLASAWNQCDKHVVQPLIRACRRMPCPAARSYRVNANTSSRKCPGSRLSEESSSTNSCCVATQATGGQGEGASNCMDCLQAAQDLNPCPCDLFGSIESFGQGQCGCTYTGDCSKLPPDVRECVLLAQWYPSFWLVAFTIILLSHVFALALKLWFTQPKGGGFFQFTSCTRSWF